MEMIKELAICDLGVTLTGDSYQVPKERYPIYHYDLCAGVVQEYEKVHVCLVIGHRSSCHRSAVYHGHYR